MPPQKHGKKVKVNVLLTDEQYDFLAALADGESVSGVIRRLVEHARQRAKQGDELEKDRLEVALRGFPPLADDK